MLYECKSTHLLLVFDFRWSRKDFDKSFRALILEMFTNNKSDRL